VGVSINDSSRSTNYRTAQYYECPTKKHPAKGKRDEYLHEVDRLVFAGFSKARNGGKDLMRGHHDPYRCMLCGHEERTHDGMLEHFRVEHPEHWPHIRPPSTFEKEVFRE
jgi:hypothetical protein